jgi:hypothetical protein
MSSKNLRKSKQRTVKKQRGGRVTFPSEYFGTESGRYFPEGSPELQLGPSAYGVNVPTSRGVLISPELSGPDLAAANHIGIQTGGKKTNPFEFIVNPETNRKVSIHSRVGKQILSNYLKKI